jgi:hypothetical protein
MLHKWVECNIILYRKELRFWKVRHLIRGSRAAKAQQMEMGWQLV